MPLVPVVTEALVSISCISSMKFLSHIQLVPAAVSGWWLASLLFHAMSFCTAQDPLCDATEQLTSLSSRRASRQHPPPRAKQWQCYYPYLQTGENETNGRDRWLCHTQKQGIADKGTVAFCPSARGCCPPCKSQTRGQEQTCQFVSHSSSSGIYW